MTFNGHSPSGNMLYGKAPELTLVGHGEGTDPRLAALARLLARRAARDFFDKQIKERS